MHEIYEISPRALDVARKVIPLPSKSLVEAKFVERRWYISEALLDADKMDELIRIGKELILAQTQVTVSFWRLMPCLSGHRL
jgi:hypothetical protein